MIMHSQIHQLFKFQSLGIKIK